jgi:hypothetical protein
MDGALDTFFLLFHSGLILFDLLAWIPRRTRRLHLLSMSLTVASWLGLGMCYGFGYCPCTDWHWQVKRRLGETHLPNSYVKYYLDAVTGGEWNSAVVDAVVVTVGILLLIVSLWANYRDWTRRTAQSQFGG